MLHLLFSLRMMKQDINVYNTELVLGSWGLFIMFVKKESFSVQDCVYV